MTLRDILLQIQLRLNPQAAQQVQQQISNTVGQGTQQGATSPQTQQAINQYEQLWKRALGRIGAMFLATFGANAIYSFIQGSIMAFAKFDQKLQQSIAIMDNVDGAMRNRLSAAARQVSKDLNIAADDLAGAYYFLASAGLSAQASLKALPIVATFAKAGLIDLGKATEYLTDANTALGYKTKDASTTIAGMSRVADVLAYVSKHAQGTIENFAQALTNKAGNSLRIFGKDIEEGAAALAVLANQGTKGALAGERLDIFLRQGAQAAVKHADAFKAYGIQIFDTSGKMKNLADISDDLTKALGGMSDEQQTIALQQLGFQTRTVAFIKAFIGQGDAIRNYEAALRSASGFAETVAKKQLLTPLEQWGLFKQRVIDVRREIGEQFIPVLGQLAKDMGDENDPSSVVGMLRLFGYWLKENKDLIADGLTGAVKGAMYFLMGFWEIMNDLADIIVFLTAGPVALLIDAFDILSIAIILPVKAMGEFIKLVSGGYIHAISDFGDELIKLENKMNAFGVKAGEVAINAAKDLFRSRQLLSQPLPRMKLGNEGKSPNNADNKKDGNALDLPTKGEVDKAKQLQEELTAMMTKQTQTREDDQIASLEKLERKYADFYGKKLPAGVKEAFEMIKSNILNLSGAQGYEDQFNLMQKIGVTKDDMQNFERNLEFQRSLVDENSTAWAEYTKIIEKAKEAIVEITNRDLQDRFQEIGNTEDDSVRLALLHDLWVQMTQLEDTVALGSKEWEIYHDMAEKAHKALIALRNDLNKKDKKDEQDKLTRDQEILLHKLENVGQRVATNLADAFGKFFEVIFIGTKKGSDAFEQFGRQIAQAGLSAIGDWAMAHSKADFISAADETWKGLAALADPFMAWSAPMHFEAAAQAAAAGALWAALGGSAGGLGSSIGGSRHGFSTGNAGENGGVKVDNSQNQGPEINIYLDGIDPKNPRHQALVGETIREYADRSGGTITIR